MPSETSDPGGPPAACPACGEAVPAGASFCPDCGADLGNPADPAYCSACGEAFDDDDRFCSNCGASRSGGGPDASEPAGRATEESADPDSSPSRSASTPRESSRAFRRRVQDHLDAGWNVERDDGDRVVLVDRGIGSVGVHILLFIFTSGIGNLLYGWWHYSKLAERRRLVRGDETAARAPSSAAGESLTETAAGYILIALLLAIGGLIAYFAATSGSPPAALIGLAFIGLGLGVAPPVRRRLDRRHGVTAFGRKKTVDHRIVRPPESVEEPCVVCGEAFERGLVRRRRDETVVAGVPVRTHSMRHNHYCADCARSELFGDRVGSPSLDDMADDAGPVDDVDAVDDADAADDADGDDAGHDDEGFADADADGGDAADDADGGDAADEADGGDTADDAFSDERATEATE
ncbi:MULTISPECIES: zinc ribbon domain-containing protein [Halorubrum]|uniref:Zinc ribbon domain-containing protein n=1 Tax=Halorubrum ruber TaxID=2982524 RepID=A0A8T8LIQ4_9EURY|nr:MULTISPECIES: zinc ribbon domain-containing protein [Halorubrum]QUO46758.1 zinc ribbon domain-containing protein [Halorubrum ruber]